MNIIAIDPGLTGALAFLTPDTATVMDMPVIDGHHRTRLIDSQLITDVVSNQWPYDVVIIEKPLWRRHDGAKQATSVWLNYGRLTACFDVWGEVTPALWKKQMGLSSDKTDSLDKARTLFPDLSSLLNRKKDHNRAEALLIGHWFLNNLPT